MHHAIGGITDRPNEVSNILSADMLSLPPAFERACVGRPQPQPPFASPSRCRLGVARLPAVVKGQEITKLLWDSGLIDSREAEFAILDLAHRQEDAGVVVGAVAAPGRGRGWRSRRPSHSSLDCGTAVAFEQNGIPIDNDISDSCPNTDSKREILDRVTAWRSSLRFPLQEAEDSDTRGRGRMRSGNSPCPTRTHVRPNR
jgi:hypothetical protein